MGVNSDFHKFADELKKARAHQHCQLCDRWTDGPCLHDGEPWWMN